MIWFHLRTPAPLSSHTMWRLWFSLKEVASIPVPLLTMLLWPKLIFWSDFLIIKVPANVFPPPVANLVVAQPYHLRGLIGLEHTATSHLPLQCQFCCCLNIDNKKWNYLQGHSWIFHPLGWLDYPTNKAPWEHHILKHFGQQIQVIIAQVLVTEFDFLLLDEVGEKHFMFGWVRQSR